MPTQEEVKPKLSPEEARKQAEELIQKTRTRKEVSRSARLDDLPRIPFQVKKSHLLAIHTSL